MTEKSLSGRLPEEVFNHLHAFAGSLATCGEEPYNLNKAGNITYDLCLYVADVLEANRHTSNSWLGALQYAPGAMGCIVEVSGKTVKGPDKQVSSATKTEKTREDEVMQRAGIAEKEAAAKDKGIADGMKALWAERADSAEPFLGGDE